MNLEMHADAVSGKKNRARWVLIMVAALFSTMTSAQEKYESWRREPPQNKAAEEWLQKEAQKAKEEYEYMSHFYISYPRTKDEYEALDGNAVAYITILGIKRSWFPVQKISVVSSGKTTTLIPIYSVLTDQTGSKSLTVKMFGQYRADILCLFPVQLRLKPGDLFVDLSGDGGRNKLTTFSATPPAAITNVMTESISGKGPSEPALVKLIQDELSGILDAPKPRKKPASEDELAGISERGKKLASYDQAILQANDALKKTKPDSSPITAIAKEENGRWQAYFGRFNEAKDKFLVAYEALRSGDSPEFKINELSTPREESGFLLAGAKAMETAKADFGYRDQPYNASVFPAANGSLYVYFLAAQTNPKSFAWGGDIRYLISSDGTKIMDKRIMHLSIHTYNAPASGKAPNSSHTVALDDIPEDSDVYYVLARKPLSDEAVVTPEFAYKIKTDGSIQYLMKTEAFVKTPKPAVKTP
jgi:hypothetical protein